MRRVALASLVLAAWSTTAAAQPREHRRDDEGVAIVNGADDALGPAVLDRLRKRLDALGALHPTPPSLAAALEGTSPVDLAPIEAAYNDLDYDQAEQLLDVALGDLLATADPATLARPVAELLRWRGMVAAALGSKDDAVADFAASLRIDPDQDLDRTALPPRVRDLYDRAARPGRRTGVVSLDLGEELDLAVDGEPPRPAPRQLRLEAGLHLLVLTAADGAHDAALVVVEPERAVRHRPELARETDASLARRLRDQAARADNDRARLDRARPLGELTGARKLLVIEGDDPDRLTVRMLDLDARTVSAPIDVRQATRPSVLAALIGLDEAAGPPRPWYKRWYVWAAAGAVVTGAAIGGYAYSQQAPDRITGF